MSRTPATATSQHARGRSPSPTATPVSAHNPSDTAVPAGRCGSAVGVPLVWALAALPIWQFAVVTAVATAIAIWAADVADRAWGTHDCQRIVVDEVVGYMATMALVPRDHWAYLSTGF